VPKCTNSNRVPTAAGRPGAPPPKEASCPSAEHAPEALWLAADASSVPLPGVCTYSCGGEAQEARIAHTITTGRSTAGTRVAEVTLASALEKDSCDPETYSAFPAAPAPEGGR
jgi:hypothetical protein